MSGTTEGSPAAAAAVPATTAQAPVTITTLAGLNSVTPEAYPTTFINNIATIFTNSKDDILSALKLNKSPAFDNARKDLRQQLITAVGNRFPEYANKRPINRKVQNTICSDIYILGFCIEQKCVQIGLDGVFDDRVEPSEPESEPVINTEDLSETIRGVSDLRQEVKALKEDKAKTAEKHAKDIAELWAEIQRMKDNPITNTQDATPENNNSNDTQQDDSSEAIQELNAILLDNTQPDTNEANAPATLTTPVQEATEPSASTRAPISPASRMTDLYIGGVSASHSCRDIKNYMNTGTDLQIELNDIKELKRRGDKKAFKVSVPHNKVSEATLIWPSEIKAERFIPANIRIKAANPPQKSGHNRNTNHNGNNINRSRNNTNNFRYNPNFNQRYERQQTFREPRQH